MARFTRSCVPGPSHRGQASCGLCDIHAVPACWLGRLRAQRCQRLLSTLHDHHLASFCSCRLHPFARAGAPIILSVRGALYVVQRAPRVPSLALRLTETHRMTGTDMQAAGSCTANM